LSETMTSIQILGIVLVFFSLYLAQRTAKANEKTEKK